MTDNGSGNPLMNRFVLPVIVAILAGTVILYLEHNTGLFREPPETPTPLVREETPPASSSYGADDCQTVVSASRDLTANGSGDRCWLRLSDGGPTELRFNDGATVTFTKLSGGNQVFFYIARKGDRLTDVVAATIRPDRQVKADFGNYEGVKQYEIAYHSPGFPAGHPACLRDANNSNAPLNALCQ